MAKKAKGHQKTIIVVLSVLIFISLAINIVQLASNISKINAANISTERLASYRGLQERQILSVKDNCRRIKDDSKNEQSAINRMRVVVSALYGTEDDGALAEEIIKRCYAPLYLISGVVFIDDDNVDELVLEDDTMFDIRENAFDQVKY